MLLYDRRTKWTGHTELYTPKASNVRPPRIDTTLRTNIGFRRSVDVEKKKRDISIGTRTAEPAVTMRRTTSDGIAASVSILEDSLAEDSFCENEIAVLMSGGRNM